MMNIVSANLESGKMIRLGTPLKNGTILEMIDNTALTTGKLLDLRTTSADAVNPVSVVTDNLDTGTTMKLYSPELTTGTGFEVTTGIWKSINALTIFMQNSKYD